MKNEIDYVVEKHVNNGMVVLKEYNDRELMLLQNPTINRERFLVIEHKDSFCRYNEINGKHLSWNDFSGKNKIMSFEVRQCECGKYCPVEFSFIGEGGETTCPSCFESYVNTKIISQK